MNNKKKKQADGIDPQEMKLHGGTEPVKGIKVTNSNEDNNEDIQALKDYYKKLQDAQRAARDKGLTR